MSHETTTSVPKDGQGSGFSLLSRARFCHKLPKGWPKLDGREFPRATLRRIHFKRQAVSESEQSGTILWGGLVHAATSQGVQWNHRAVARPSYGSSGSCVLSIATGWLSFTYEASVRARDKK